MTNLPSLKNWEETGRSLQQASALLGAVRKLLVAPLPNYLELSLEVQPAGLSSGQLPGGGEIRLNFNRAELAFRPEGGLAQAVPLAGHTQRTLFEELLRIMAAAGHELGEKTETLPSYTAAFAAALEKARGGANTYMKRLAGETQLVVDQMQAADYAQVQYRLFTALARFRARLNGSMSPIVVWPHGFDLSTLWFATEKADERSPHMNFGFAPYSNGFPRPYLYSYVYPLPADFRPEILPAGAYWNTHLWTGVVLPYDKLLGSPDAEVAIEQALLAIHRALLPAVQ